MATFVGLATGVGLSVLLSPHDKSFEDCVRLLFQEAANGVAREMRWHAQVEPGVRRICAKHHGVSLAD
jgi:hypothetical protein